MRLILPLISLFLCFGSVEAADGFHSAGSWEHRGQTVLDGLRARVCKETRHVDRPSSDRSTLGADLTEESLLAACDGVGSVTGFHRSTAGSSMGDGGIADGMLLDRERLMTGYGVAVDLVAYTSSGLAVGGILCYPDDGQPHSAVVHLHGGFGGIFDDADGNMLETCVNWALLHHRTALAPSFRGQDGGEGSLEICLGEANDVAAGTAMLRTLPTTDPDRVALVGGSVGGCVALRAATMIRNLKAVVAFVPPSDWEKLVGYHRASFVPATELNCDGQLVQWNIGGPKLANVIDNVICGHPGCPSADYAVRSTLPGVFSQTAPTMIVSAESDNVVPVDQQMLYSIMRQRLGYPVDVYVVDHCAAPAAPAPAQDVHVMVNDAYHGLDAGSVSSGLLFLMEALDR